jgi:quercetin 2,3-dioxygenase
VTSQDVGPSPAASSLDRTLDISESRESQVGSISVRRALPRKGRRTVGAWCFLDHFGPLDVTVGDGMDVAPHPHMGLQTVTWLLAGEVVHRDSLGTEQVIRPGQLNLMTAGHGVVHSEERTGTYAGEFQGLQLWVAQPEETRGGSPDFEHHAQLPIHALDGAMATVLVGDFEGAHSPARRDTEHVGIDLELHGTDALVPLHAHWEYAIVVIDGLLSIDDQVVVPGHLAYLGRGRDEIRLSAQAPARTFLLGGIPFEETILMWWNFVARTQSEVTVAYDDWHAAHERFGPVASTLPRMQVAPPPWVTAPH